MKRLLLALMVAALALIALAPAAGAKVFLIQAKELSYLSQGLQYKPTEFAVSDDSGVIGAVWQTWNGRRATGTGKVGSLDYGYNTVRMELSKPKRCGTHVLFSKLVLVDVPDPGDTTTRPDRPVTVGCAPELVSDVSLGGGFTEQKFLFRPDRVLIGDSSLRSISWRGWGHERARGSGGLYASNVHGTPARMTVGDLGYCASVKRFLYRKYTLKYRQGGHRRSATRRMRRDCRG